MTIEIVTEACAGLDILSLIINIGLTLSSLAISLIAFCYSYRVNRVNIENIIYTDISESKYRIDCLLYEMVTLKRKDSQKIAQKNALNPFIESYLNSLNHGCLLYNNKDISQKRFKDMLYNDITGITKNKHFTNVLLKNKEGYTELLKVIDTWNIDSNLINN